MYIERIEVEEGFLDGLNLGLSEGLNVLIGARGTGKTSVIELLRFCLGAPAYTEEATRRGVEQVRSVLQGGQVTVTIADGQSRWTASRSVSDEQPRVQQLLPPITILAQNEIEAVGAKASSRLQLLDTFGGSTPQLAKEASTVVASLRSLTAEVRDVLEQTRSIQRQLDELVEVPAELEEATQQQADALESVAATKEDQQELERLQVEASRLSVRHAVLGRTTGQIATAHSGLEDITRRQPIIEEWPDAAGGPDLVAPAREAVLRVRDLLSDAAGVMSAAREELAQRGEEVRQQRSKTEEGTRSLRRRLDALQEGVGALTERVNALREKAGQREALMAVKEDQAERLKSLVEERAQAYSRLEDLRVKRFARREEIAHSLTRALSPQIRVVTTKSSARSTYISALTAGLRGSGLHYNTLAPQLAEAVAPIELVECAESGDADRLATISGLPYDRARAVVDYLGHAASTADIVSATIDDGVRFELLHGLDYKDSSKLSIGQRCTVVLPILLEHSAGVLVADQPEDHIDNSFIADTVVASLRKRMGQGQVIFASHNANIPVLGEASRIIRMGSDGRRGYVLHAGPLDDPASIAAITTVLEGGREAFEKRAEFYGGQG